jgi:hypothetical protein
MDKPWLEQYGGQTAGELVAMRDRYRIDSLLCALEMGIEQSLARRDLNDLSVPEWTLLAIQALQREVNNGGYHQFFINSSADYIHGIVAALMRIGCPEQAAIAAEAIAAAGITEDMEPAAISEHVEEFSEESQDRLGAFDQRFYACRENLDDASFAYIEKHQAEIRLP